VKTPDSEAPVTYAVTLYPAIFRRVELEPPFVRVSIKLLGVIDSLWCRSFETLAAGADRFSMFRLDPSEAVVQVICRTTDGVAEIRGLMERSRLLLELTNLHATLQAQSEKQQSA
jgi:hypothetical protein